MSDNINCPVQWFHLRGFFCGSIVSRFLCQMFLHCPTSILYLSSKKGILFVVDEDLQAMGRG